jgi:hypothetical protein
MNESNNIPTVLYSNLATTGFNGAKAKGQSAAGGESWFEALADAWGSAMDKQADKITALSNMIQGDGTTAPNTAAADPGAQKLAGETTTGNTSGSDQPSVMVKLSAESMKMSFMANSESTSMSSTAQALETMAKKG